MSHPFSDGDRPAKRMILSSKSGLQRPSNYAIYILAEPHTNIESDCLRGILQLHFGKTAYGISRILADLSENHQAEVAIFPYDVAATKIAEIKDGRYGSRLDFDLDCGPARKPRLGPV